MLECVKGFKSKNYCIACFDGNYPIEFGGEADKYAMDKRLKNL
jgi:glutamine phosphoribosylpyrophosphate amidotransferase